MRELKMKVYRLLKDDDTMVPLPAYATNGSACLDFYSANTEPIEIPMGKTKMVPLGVKVAVEPGYQLLLFARSGIATKQGISLANGVGVVDSDYRGEVMVGLCNRNQPEFVVEPNMRICQGQIMKAPQYAFVEVLSEEELGETIRGEGGFGSSKTGVIKDGEV